MDGTGVERRDAADEGSGGSIDRVVRRRIGRRDAPVVDRVDDADRRDRLGRGVLRLEVAGIVVGDQSADVQVSGTGHLREDDVALMQRVDDLLAARERRRDAAEGERVRADVDVDEGDVALAVDVLEIDVGGSRDAGDDQVRTHRDGRRPGVVDVGEIAGIGAIPDHRVVVVDRQVQRREGDPVGRRQRKVGVVVGARDRDRIGRVVGRYVHDRRSIAEMGVAGIARRIVGEARMVEHERIFRGLGGVRDADAGGADRRTRRTVRCADDAAVEQVRKKVDVACFEDRRIARQFAEDAADVLG